MTLTAICDAMRVAISALPPGRPLIYAYAPSSWWDRLRMRSKLWAAVRSIGFEVESAAHGSHGYFVVVARRSAEVLHEHQCPACTVVRACAADACRDVPVKLREFCAGCLARAARGERVPVLIPTVRTTWRTRP